MDDIPILTALERGILTLEGQFLNSSNSTFLGQVEYEGTSVRVVYKPVRGENQLWDFPTGTLAKREVAAYRVSEALGWRLVPPTVFRRKAILGRGSVQLYMDHDPEYHAFRFSEQDQQRLRPVCLFDLVINNADRKAGHILMDAQKQLWLIDHGICFHVENKLRSVVWIFAGEPIPLDFGRDLSRFAEILEDEQSPLVMDLKKYLRIGEIRAMRRRTINLLDAGVFPHPDESRRYYPLPPV